MPAPEAAVFERLRDAAAVDSAADHPTRTITEVFTGNPLGEVPVGTTADVEAAFDRARPAAREWAARTPTDRAEETRPESQTSAHSPGFVAT